MDLPELDILLYAHDGRGLGHISRTTAIGLALRRLYPELRVLLLTGYGATDALIHNGHLDWLKLPAYRTRITKGKSRGIDGHSGYSDQQLGQLRGRQIQNIVRQLRPKVILADHTPQGKHRELQPALEAGSSACWLLGVRGIVGDVPQASSQSARELFRNHYSGLLWYGDSSVTGTKQQRMLTDQYQALDHECGYVSRLREIQHLAHSPTKGKKKLAGTIALPWLGEHAHQVLAAMGEALKIIGPDAGQWHIFADIDPGLEQAASFQQLDFCRLHRPGPLYIDSLLRSRTALLYGGYNSLTDLLSAGTPAVVLLRGMQDNEQEEHLRLLSSHSKNRLITVKEQQVTGKELASALLRQLELPVQPSTINLDGAENAARLLATQVTHHQP